MTRLPNGKRRALIGFVATAVMIGLVPAAANAQAPAPQPVIDSAPKELGFGRTAVIKGHLEDGTPGDTVVLEQRRSFSDWRVASEKTVDDRLKVRFKRQDMRKTTQYRLGWEGIDGVMTYSKVITVRVKPRITLKVKPRDIFMGHKVRLFGRVYPAVAGRSMMLQQKIHGEWVNLDKVGVGDGEFRSTFKARHKGNRRVRVVFSGDKVNRSAKTTKPMTIYRRDRATWYGPGFYGNTTACGKTLTQETLGVAHRTLPCGTEVSILYNGRTITVPVIDRGPYSHANWDLTSETAERLGFSGTDDIGVTK